MVPMGPPFLVYHLTGFLMTTETPEDSVSFRYAPQRWCGVKVMIDTNAINARQKNSALNQLEKWRFDGVIYLLLPERAHDEAVIDGNTLREQKAGTFIRANSARISEEQHARYAAIEAAILPNGVSSSSQRNDVDIVYEASAWGHIVVTSDGDSRRQPRGILGAGKNWPS